MRTVKDKNGGTFIVTSNGLCYMDKDFNIRLLTAFPYFNNYDVFVSPQNELFVSGSAGIYVLNADDALSDSESSADYELLDAKRGLSSALIANSWSCADSRQNLYLCCSTGVFNTILKEAM